MFWWLTLGFLLLGGVLGGLGLRRAIRGRLAPTPRPDRLRQVLLWAGGILLVAPDLIPALVADPPGVFGTITLWVWRFMAIGGIGLVALTAAVTSRRAVQKVRGGAANAAIRVPSWSGRRERRDLNLDDFPHTWDGLLDYDRQLSRRLVSYQHDLELLANRPAMLDYTDPCTRAAIHAMTMCDRERRDFGPVTRDVIKTPYGQAVAQFAVALREAEYNADRQARSGLGVDERARLTEASRILAFVQDNATTGSDRQRAYEHVAALLVADQVPGERDRSHPWLDVHERVS